MKTFIRFKTVAALALLTAVSAGCELDDITSINDNPNAPTELGAQYTFPTAIRSAAMNLQGESGIDLPVTELWVQHVARLQYGSTDRYDLDTNWPDGLWLNMWEEPLAQIQDALNNADDPNQEAVALIWKSYLFHNMTDLWGDIPYFEALRGNAEDGTTEPAYDPQAEIYDDLFRQLEAAQDMIEPGAAGHGSADLIYGGNMDRWRRFANSLRLRLAMRISDIDPSRAATEAAAAVADGVMMSVEDGARLAWPGQAPNQNPMYLGFLSRPGDFRVSRTFVDTLATLNDPRLAYNANPAESDGVFRGMPNGEPDQHDYGFTTVSKVGDWHLDPAAPTIFMSYAEVQLLLAEAAVKGWAGGGASAYYEEGIRASMARYGIAGDPVDAYLDQPEVAWNPARGMEQIALQYWIDLYDQGPEAYAKWRRTDIPRLDGGTAAVNQKRPPVRFPYPTTEIAKNPANLEEAQSRQGGATLNSPVWWDVEQPF